MMMMMMMMMMIIKWLLGLASFAYSHWATQWMHSNNSSNNNNKMCA